MLLPAIDDETILCDRQVIFSALPKIEQVYKDSGLSVEDAREAALAAWKKVRLGSPLQPNKCMSASSYKLFTLSLGPLTFKTNPSDADINLDGNNLKDRTEHRRLFEAGKRHRIRYSKSGYESVEIDCAAVEHANTICYAELRPAP